MRKSSNVIFLTTATLLWGLSVVSQTIGNSYMGPFTFNVARFSVSVLAMIPCLLFIVRYEKLKGRQPITDSRALIFGGGISGVAFFLSISLQQVGLVTVPAGKAIFITSLYMIFIPVVNFFRGRRANGWVWAGVFLAVTGMYFLCVNGSFSMTRGELLCLGCAFGYTAHILLIDHYSPRVNAFFYTEIQFLVVAILSFLPMILFESPEISAIIRGWQPLCYSGIVAGCAAYTLQAIGQRNFDPAVASLLLSMETVYAAVGAWIILGQAMNAREIVGCVMMFCAVILAQLPLKKN